MKCYAGPIPNMLCSWSGVWLLCQHFFRQLNYAGRDVVELSKIAKKVLKRVNDGTQHFDFVVKSPAGLMRMDSLGLIFAQMSILKEAIFASNAPHQSFAEDTS